MFGSNDFHQPTFKLPVRYLFGHSGGAAKAEPLPMPTGELRAALEGLGWVYLEERTADLDIGGQKFRFRGTGDAHHERDDYSAVAGPASPDAVEIGVTHAPYLRLLDAMTADGVAMIFAGHTHGGQVCIPGRGALVTNCDLPREHASGLFTYDAGGHESYVNVSAGVGMSPFAPYRFACPPEVSLLTLVRSLQLTAPGRGAEEFDVVSMPSLPSSPRRSSRLTRDRLSKTPAPASHPAGASPPAPASLRLCDPARLSPARLSPRLFFASHPVRNLAAPHAGERPLHSLPAPPPPRLRAPTASTVHRSSSPFPSVLPSFRPPPSPTDVRFPAGLRYAVQRPERPSGCGAAW